MAAPGGREHREVGGDPARPATSRPLPPPPALVLSCEHGGNQVPPRWRQLFRDARAALDGHRGWDPGALELARYLAERLDAPLLASSVTRLLVEPNRSLGHPRLFSELTRALPQGERELLVRRYWRPHRERVERAVRDTLGRAGSVLHLGVHTFTPVLDGAVREVAVGVLYDPAREGERAFCRRWLDALREALPDLRCRANAPYRGTSDGLTTYLRTILPRGYMGVELEVRQDLLASPHARRVSEAVARTLERLVAPERAAA